MALCWNGELFLGEVGYGGLAIVDWLCRIPIAAAGPVLALVSIVILSSTATEY
jgi:hypothetical protein